MKLGNTPESMWGIDDTGMSRMLKNVIDSYYKNQDLSNYDLPPGGYAHWITNELNNLSPQEYKMMHENNLSLQDIYMLRNLGTYKTPSPINKRNFRGN